MSHNTAYLALGSNINPVKNFKAALEMLTELTELIAISSVWETRPMGLLTQANFLNGAAIVKTDFTAAAFKQNVLHPIEQKLGRVRQADKNAPRTIDLDIVLFNRDIFALGQNHIPDPDIYRRPFLALPLAELTPAYVHPETGETLREIAAHFTIDPTEMWLRPDVVGIVRSI